MLNADSLGVCREDMLRESLEEEKQADIALTTLAEYEVNPDAVAA